MPLALFGVTNTLVGTDRLANYGFDANSAPTSTVLTGIINRAAAQVNGHLSAIGITPSAIDATNEPISYYNLQGLVLDGSAAEAARIFRGRAEAEGLVNVWKTQWDDGIKRLANRQKAKSFLADTMTTSHAGFMRTHVQDAGATSTASDVVIGIPIATAAMDL